MSYFLAFSFSLFFLAFALSFARAARPHAGQTAGPELDCDGGGGRVVEGLILGEILQEPTAAALPAAGPAEDASATAATANPEPVSGAPGPPGPPGAPGPAVVNYSSVYGPAAIAASASSSSFFF